MIMLIRDKCAIQRNKMRHLFVTVPLYKVCVLTPIALPVTGIKKNKKKLFDMWRRQRVYILKLLNLISKYLYHHDEVMIFGWCMVLVGIFVDWLNISY